MTFRIRPNPLHRTLRQRPTVQRDQEVVPIVELLVPEFGREVAENAQPGVLSGGAVRFCQLAHEAFDVLGPRSTAKVEFELMIGLPG